MMNRALNSILFCLIFCSTFVANADSEALTTYKALYEDSLKKIGEAHQEKVLNLGDLYVDRLSSLKGQYQSMGNLEGVLKVDEEQKAVMQSMPLLDLPEGSFAELVTVRGQYHTALSLINTEFSERKNELNEKFILHLTALQTKLTQENEIEQAMAVRAEVQRLEAGKNEVDASVAEIISDAVSPYRILWGMPQRGPQIQAFSEGIQSKYNIVVDKDVDLKKEGIICLGGRGEVERFGTGFLDAVLASNAFTLIVEFEVASLKPLGPARILSYSKGANNRNFTLGQQRRQLVMRLRTTDTNPNGHIPKLVLGELQVGVPTKVVFSYGPNGAVCYRDGEKVDLVEINGDLSNWEEMFFMIGNEKGQNRPWRGTIYSFALSNEAMSAAAAQEASIR